MLGPSAGFIYICLLDIVIRKAIYGTNGKRYDDLTNGHPNWGARLQSASCDYLQKRRRLRETWLSKPLSLYSQWFLLWYFWFLKPMSLLAACRILEQLRQRCSFLPWFLLFKFTETLHWGERLRILSYQRRVNPIQSGIGGIREKRPLQTFRACNLWGGTTMNSKFWKTIPKIYLDPIWYDAPLGRDLVFFIPMAIICWDVRRIVCDVVPRKWAPLYFICFIWEDKLMMHR